MPSSTAILCSQMYLRPCRSPEIHETPRVLDCRPVDGRSTSLFRNAFSVTYFLRTSEPRSSWIGHNWGPERDVFSSEMSSDLRTIFGRAVHEVLAYRQSQKSKLLAVAAEVGAVSIAQPGQMRDAIHAECDARGNGELWTNERHSIIGKAD